MAGDHYPRNISRALLHPLLRRLRLQHLAVAEEDLRSNRLRRPRHRSPRQRQFSTASWAFTAGQATDTFRAAAPFWIPQGIFTDSPQAEEADRQHWEPCSSWIARAMKLFSITFSSWQMTGTYPLLVLWLMLAEMLSEQRRMAGLALPAWAVELYLKSTALVTRPSSTTSLARTEMGRIRMGSSRMVRGISMVLPFKVALLRAGAAPSSRWIRRETKPFCTASRVRTAMDHLTDGFRETRD